MPSHLSNPAALPAPDADASAHSERVAAHVRAVIADAGGWIPFERYMREVLYAPGLGYYVAGAAKLGAAGDFVTAPEMTPLFGATLASPVAAILDGSGAREIVELGAGSGALAEEPPAFAGDRRRGDFAIPHRGSESRPARATARRARGCARARGVVRCDAARDGRRGAPERGARRGASAPRGACRRPVAGAWRELSHGTLRFADRPLDNEALREMAQARFPAGEDYVSEINPGAEALVATLSRALVGGAIVLIDYGFPQAEYYHPQRSAGTLVGHYRHRVHVDPFLWPGLSDLTAHVDFTAIATAAHEQGLAVAGYASQAAFLTASGILDRLAAVGAPESVAYIRAAAAVQRLLSPAEMGELFKVLVLSRDDGIVWRYFAGHDRSHRL